MGRRVLLCDDELHITKAAEFKLKNAGFEVRCASHGEEAWKLIQEQLPDLLVTDYQMPVLDGLSLCARLRAQPLTRELPIILLSGKGFELDRDELAARYGIIDVIAKPFSPREFLKAVQQRLGVSPASPVLA